MAGPRQLRRLLDSVLTVSSQLDLHTVLRTIAETAAELVSAEFAALGVLNRERTKLDDFITVGVSDQLGNAIGHLPEGHGILGLLIVDPKPLRLVEIADHAERFGFPPHHPPMGSFLGVPIAVRGEVFGNLYLCNKSDGEGFTDADEELVVGLAAAAGIAIENANLHARVAELATVEDRERIARDLHDTVIQRLFAIGLALQGTIRLTSDPVIHDRLTTLVDDLDKTVRDVRASIFELHSARLPGRSLRQDLLQVCGECARALGFDPVVRFDGPIDTAVGPDLADDICAVGREMLTNVAKHAKATSVELSMVAKDGMVQLSIVDDGIGLTHQNVGGRGLANLAARAKKRSGSFEMLQPRNGGTALIWCAPYAT